MFGPCPDGFTPAERLRRGDARTLLAHCRLDGLTVLPTDDGRDLRVIGSDWAIARWKPFLALRKDEALQELLYGLCDRCGVEGRPLVANWWGSRGDEVGPHERVCGECAGVLTAGLGLDLAEG